MATETLVKNKALLDDSDITELFEHRVSLDLTPENAKFTRSAGNLISLELTQPSGKVEFFERIVPVRAFPISSPDHFISIREPDSQLSGRGAELGMIEDLAAFPAEMADLIIDELGRDAFPRIRMGIGAKPHPDYNLADWVLSTFPPSELDTLRSLFPAACDGIERLIRGDLDGAMQVCNRKG